MMFTKARWPEAQEHFQGIAYTVLFQSIWPSHITALVVLAKISCWSLITSCLAGPRIQKVALEHHVGCERPVQWPKSGVYHRLTSTWLMQNFGQSVTGHTSG